MSNTINGSVSYYLYRYKDTSSGRYLTEEEYEDAIDLGLPEWLFEDMEIELNAEYEGEWVDEGIGGYEYWGCRGVDHNWCFEVSEIAALDENGKDWWDELTEEEQNELTKYCEEDGKSYCDD